MLLAVCFTGACCAQAYPARPIRVVIGFGAGGSTDAIGRYYAQRLGEILKAPVVLENKPGAGQMVAINALVAAPADGYTLFLGSASVLSQAPGIRRDLPYDPLKDWTLIALVSTAPGVIVSAPDLPVRTLRELVAYSQANPARLNYGSSGVGSASHLQTEYLSRLTGLKAVHIPLKADNDIMREMAVGSVHFGLSPVQGAIPHIQSGKARALAVTGSKRLKSLPDVPSLSEMDFKGVQGIDPYTYYGLVGPTGLPATVVARLNEAVNSVPAMPGVAAFIRDRLYNEPGTGSPEDFRTFIRADIGKWKAFERHIKVAE